MLWQAGMTLNRNLQSRPARRFRSNWMAVIVHGAQLLLNLVVVLAVILGAMAG
jgi:hypothetical protein